jgi:hypothetical protein
MNPLICRGDSSYLSMQPDELVGEESKRAVTVAERGRAGVVGNTNSDPGAGGRRSSSSAGRDGRDVRRRRAGKGRRARAKPVFVSLRAQIFVGHLILARYILPPFRIIITPSRSKL